MLELFNLPRLAGVPAISSVQRLGFFLINLLFPTAGVSELLNVTKEEEKNLFAEVHPLSSTSSRLGDQTGSAFLMLPLHVWMYLLDASAGNWQHGFPLGACRTYSCERALVPSRKVTFPSVLRHLLFQPTPLSPGNFSSDTPIPWRLEVLFN